MKLYVGDWEVEVELSDTIESVKAKIYDRYGIAVALQVLYSADLEFEDGKILSDYNIQEDATLDFSVRIDNKTFNRRHLARESSSRQG